VFILKNQLGRFTLSMQPNDRSLSGKLGDAVFESREYHQRESKTFFNYSMV
jgi:hypothetical protein